MTNLLLGDPRIIHDAENEKLKLQKESESWWKLRKMTLWDSGYWGAQQEKASGYCPNAYATRQLLPRGRYKTWLLPLRLLLPFGGHGRSKRDLLNYRLLFNHGCIFFCDLAFKCGKRLYYYNFFNSWNLI